MRIIADKKRLDWYALAEELREMVSNATPETAVKVDVLQSMEGAEGIDVVPAETNKCNYIIQLEEIVDFTRCKGLGSWADIKDGKVRVHIS